MNNLPPSSKPRYQKIKKLGSNLNGNKATYLATDNITNKSVVIKEFQFAYSTSDRSSFKAYEREIQVLSFLEHPGIPRYLNSFETANGFSIVQEYKNAQSLAVNSELDFEKIKKITVDCLEILIYLQNRVPPVIHRDIKPENILIDDLLNVYLVDFGFARIGSSHGAVSSVATGTFGFMAPEQLYNKNLSLATDLYGLGATIICLLTGTKSSEVNTLINDNGRFNFKDLLTKLAKLLTKLANLDSHFIEWLEKMVEPKQKERFSSAEKALIALNSPNLGLLPEVYLSENSIELNVHTISEKIVKLITVSNSNPNTLLEGSWKVAPHPNDQYSQTSFHPWISFKPNKFKSNQTICSITIDTNKLFTDQVYHRDILLKTNSKPTTYRIALQVNVLNTGILTYPLLLFLAIMFMMYLTATCSGLVVINFFQFLVSSNINFLIFSLLLLTILTPINIFLIKRHRKILRENNRNKYYKIFINLDIALFLSYFNGAIFLILINLAGINIVNFNIILKYNSLTLCIIFAIANYKMLIQEFKDRLSLKKAKRKFLP